MAGSGAWISDSVSDGRWFVTLRRFVGRIVIVSGVVFVVVIVVRLALFAHSGVNSFGREIVFDEPQTGVYGLCLKGMKGRG